MYQAAENRYGSMEYKRSGRSGVLLPRISLGLWQNFGLEKSLEEQEAVLFRAFDMGIIHFDLANNYGFPAVGKAEENFGSALRDGLGRYRDELFISTKAGFDFWPGPYGNWGSRKYLMASLDSSLKRMGLEYVDVFYHHRPDLRHPWRRPWVPLSDMVRQESAVCGDFQLSGRGSRGSHPHTEENKIPVCFTSLGTICSSAGRRTAFELLDREGVGCICYSPLAQGALTGRYLDGIPEGSRASKEGTTVGGRYLTEDKLVKIRALNKMAGERGQSLAQMALAWVLRRKEVTSVLIGASSIAQLEDNAKALDSPAFSCEELADIEGILKG